MLLIRHGNKFKQRKPSERLNAAVKTAFSPTQPPRHSPKKIRLLIPFISSVKNQQHEEDIICDGSGYLSVIL
jgi:hypothetical protein